MNRKYICFKMLFFATMVLGIIQTSYGIDPSVLYHLSEEGNKDSNSGSSSRNDPLDEAEDDEEETPPRMPRPVTVMPREENPTSASEQTRLGQEKELRYKNYEEAVKWYRKAADQGYAEAQISLGAHYSLGLSVDQDLKTAAEWYRRAAEQGNLKGQMWSIAVKRGKAFLKIKPKP